MQAIIHIGIEKTGTTAIQAFLVANRDTLQARGVFLPDSLGRPSNRFLAIMVRDEPQTDRLFDRRGISDPNRRLEIVAQWQAAWDRELADSTCELCLISSEHLHSTLRHDTEIARLAATLRARFTAELRIIVYIRDQLDQLLSARSTALKSGSTSYDIAPAQEYQNLDYRKMIEQWGTVFGEQALCVRLFDPVCWPNGDLIADFMAACGLEFDGLERPKAGRNPRLDALGQRLLRTFNHRVTGFDPRHQMALRAGLIPFVEQHFSTGRAAGVSAALIDEFQTHFAASNEWVRARYFPTRNQLFAPQTYPPVVTAENDLETERMISAFIESWIASHESRQTPNHAPQNPVGPEL